MPSSTDFILERNRAQKGSETDTFTLERYRQMFGHLPADAVRVMDVGCNTGRGGEVLKALNPRLQLVGLDCIPERIEKLDPGVYDRGICSFSNKIEAANDSFDSIVAGECLEHVPPTEIDDSLCEYFRLLRLRGRLILTTPNPHYLKNRLKGLSVLTERSHLTQHYPESLKLRLKAIGYSHIRFFGSGRMTRHVGQNIPWLSIYGSYLVTADKW